MPEAAGTSASSLFARHEDLGHLLWSLENGEGFNLYFCRCNSPLYREQLIAAIIARYSGPIAEINLGALSRQYDLSHIPIDHALADSLKNYPSDKNVFLCGLEILLPTEEAQRASSHRVLRQLNWRRSEFQRLQCNLVIWAPKYALDWLAQYAPDFFDWYSGSFGFDAPAQKTSIAESLCFEPIEPVRIAPHSHNLPELQKSGFYGRSRELKRIERAFKVEGIRCLSITGFGGQGKTYLAIEAGRWLLRAGMFQRACIVSYADFQGVAPADLAVTALAAVLEQNLIDADAATEALAKIPALLILDSLEFLPEKVLSILLDRAVQWSEAGESRVLLISRMPDFHHAAYPAAGSPKHRQLQLKGMEKAAALAWVNAIIRLPPAAQAELPVRAELLKLFWQVGFHPLSIALLAEQLKTCRPTELSLRLEELLTAEPADKKNHPLIASLLGAGDENAVKFADNVNLFLNTFGLLRDHESLAACSAETAGASGSGQWRRTRFTLGQQLFNTGRAEEALRTFEEVLAVLGEQQGYEHCQTLDWLGRCLRMLGRLKEAEARYREALATAKQLKQPSDIKRLTGTLQTDLADVLTDRGDYAGARTAYEAALKIAMEQDNQRKIAVVNSQLGTLALRQNDLTEAARRYRKGLGIFQALKEPDSEAVVWHQLGLVYQKNRQWDAAEQAYRKAERLEEERGNLQNAAKTWNQLAIVTEYAGKPHEADAWYRKAIEGGRTAGDKLGVSMRLSNFADLLVNHFPDRLAEARLLAEESLAIKKTLDPAAAEIWKTYGLLAQIADCQGDTVHAAKYHR
ncbi:MAG: tetratricopeptide repeat protein, partial [Gammaproteobacteria bacterium]|nr:tetratricopeptide repeat protein [Gammaproteobacteria bacterium]